MQLKTSNNYFAVVTGPFQPITFPNYVSTFRSMVIIGSGSWFVLFQQIINHKNKATQRIGVESNGAMLLQPVEAPGPVCQ